MWIIFMYVFTNTDMLILLKILISLQSQDDLPDVRKLFFQRNTYSVRFLLHLVFRICYTPANHQFCIPPFSRALKSVIMY